MPPVTLPQSNACRPNPHLAVQPRRRHIVALLKQRPRLRQVDRVALGGAAVWQGTATRGARERKVQGRPPQGTRSCTGRRCRRDHGSTGGGRSPPIAAHSTGAQGASVARQARPTQHTMRPPPAAVHQGRAVVALPQVHPPHVAVLASGVHLQRVVACQRSMWHGRNEGWHGGSGQPLTSLWDARGAHLRHTIARHVRQWVGTRGAPPACQQHRIGGPAGTGSGAASQSLATHLPAHRCAPPPGRGTAPVAWWPRRAPAPQTAPAAPPARGGFGGVCNNG